MLDLKFSFFKSHQLFICKIANIFSAVCMAFGFALHSNSNTAYCIFASFWIESVMSRSLFWLLKLWGWLWWWQVTMLHTSHGLDHYCCGSWA